MATTTKLPTEAQVVKTLGKILTEADERKLQLGDKAAIERTIRILKRK